MSTEVTVLPPDEFGELVEIDQDEFEKILSYFPQATRIWVAWKFRCKEIELEHWCNATYQIPFSQVKQHLYMETKMKLSFRQHEIALSGSLPALQWLGMNNMEQSVRTSQPIPPPPTERTQIKLAYSVKDIRETKDESES